MLAEDAGPTIRWAILKRLDKEPGANLVGGGISHCCQGDTYWDYDTNAEAVAVLPFFRVVTEIVLDGLIETVSRFDLPIPFELRHLHNEIDEIAEHFKAVRREFYGRGAPMLIGTEKQLKGNGMRGNWKKYG